MSQITKEQFKLLYTAKGWTATKLAKRWGYKDTSRIHQIARDENRPLRYDDMLLGLPLNKR